MKIKKIYIFLVYSCGKENASNAYKNNPARISLDDQVNPDLRFIINKGKA